MTWSTSSSSGGYEGQSWGGSHNFSPSLSSTNIPLWESKDNADITRVTSSRLVTSRVTFLVLGILSLLLAIVALLGALFCLPGDVVIPIFVTGFVLIVLALCFSLYAVAQGKEFLTKYNGLIDKYNKLVEERENFQKESESCRSSVYELQQSLESVSSIGKKKSGISKFFSELGKKSKK